MARVVAQQATAAEWCYTSNESALQMMRTAMVSAQDMVKSECMRRCCLRCVASAMRVCFYVTRDMATRYSKRYKMQEAASALMPTFDIADYEALPPDDAASSCCF